MKADERSTAAADASRSLTTEIAALRAELARLNAHRFVAMHDSLPKLVWFNFLRGLAFGLGSVVGATVLVSLAVYALSQIDFIPIIGDWARQIAAEIAAARGNR